MLEEFPSTAALGLHGLAGDRSYECVPQPSPTISSMLGRTGTRPSPADVELPTGEVKTFLVIDDNC